MENGQLSNGANSYPNVGIVAMDIYFPSTYVNQAELEIFDGVSKDKYTIGLGQTDMAFASDREDICSMSLTVVKNLMEKYQISYADIGRLEVGTESAIDKSKSVKSVIMQLFDEKGNTDIEGIDVVNACYGGTGALFNAVNWIESSNWDGRYALVVAGDIALYEKGPARPTGGAGVVAMLIGRDAPLVIESGIRGNHMEHAYDFYKPVVLHSEYPVVDGQLSIKCYLKSLDTCYARYQEKFKKVKNEDFDLNKVDFACFHCPYSKLVQKGFARLLYRDYLSDPSKFPGVPDKFKDLPVAETYINPELERTFIGLSSSQFTNKVLPSMFLAKELGNCYCGSLYSCLLSLISDKNVADSLVGKRIVMFSYGSGLASSMFSFKVNKSLANICQKADIHNRINSRTKFTPEEFTETLAVREKAVQQHVAYVPSGNLEFISKGSFYLTNVDDAQRRFYVVKQ